jgi:hypothetical protein
MKTPIKIWVTFFVMCSFVSFVDAQDTYPGYKGRNNVVSVNTYYGFSFGRSKMEFPNGIIIKQTSFVPDFQYELGFAHTVNRKIGFGFTAWRFTSSFEMAAMDRMNIPDSYKAQIVLGGVERELTHITGFGIIRATTVGLSMKRFRPEYGALAPVGAYYSFNINTHFLNVDLGNIQASGENYRFSKYYAAYTNRTNIRMNFVLGFGSSKAFIKRWVRDFGIKFCLLNAVVGASGMKEATISEQKFIDSAINTRQNWFDNIRIHYSIGYLL